MKSVLSLLLLAGTATLKAEELPAPLAPLAAKYREQIDGLATARDAAIKNAGLDYLAALRLAEEKATAGGDAGVLEAIEREKTAAEGGGPGLRTTDGVPKQVTAAHKVYLKAVADAGIALAKNRKDMDAKYLASLRKITPVAGAGGDLATKVAEEKRLVETGRIGPITDLAVSLPGSRWHHVNDAADIWAFNDGKLNNSWKYATPEPGKLVVSWSKGDTATLLLGRDGKTLIETGGKPVFKLIEDPK